MLTKGCCSFPSAGESRLYKKPHDSLLYFIILLVVVTTFATQNRTVGFEPGHHGWVSSHALAIISKANSDNQFVGYTMAFKDDENKEQYYYFDRYPVFFSAFFNVILSLSNNLATKVYVARQAMNFIFLGTLIMAFMLVNKLIADKHLALSVVLIAFSNLFLLYYKDMVHFDQPALFGFVFLLFSIAVYKLDGKRKLLYLATFVSIGLGRGYASYAIMVLWAIIEFSMLMKSPNSNFGEGLRKFLKHDSFIVFIVGLVWGASLLTYSISIEARQSEIPLTQTGIVQNALKRLSFDKAFNERYADRLNWVNFTRSQIERIIDWSIPLTHRYITFFRDLYRRFAFFRYLILLPMFILVPIFIKKAEPKKRLILLLMIFSGFLWNFLMRSLTAFHDYTTMYYIGVALALYMATFSYLKSSRKYTLCLLMLCVIIYATACFFVNKWHSSQAEEAKDYTYDFNRIVQVIEGQGKNIHIQDGYRNIVPGAPYATGFYLAEHYVTPLDVSDYVISSNRVTTQATPQEYKG